MPRWTAAYELLRSAAVLGWWIALYASPAFRSSFFDPAHERLLFGLAIPDLTVLCILSAVAGVAGERRTEFTRIAVTVLAGASLYATLFTLGLTMTTAAGVVGLVFMAPMTLVDLYLCKRANP